MTTPAPEAAPAGREEIRSLTGVRILAALWVVFFHFGFTPGIRDAWFWKPFAPVTDAGGLGVDLFYVLSGFVITLTYLEALGPRPGVRSAVGFWWARVCRIWPVYATVTSLFGLWLVLKIQVLHNQPVTYQVVQPQVDLPHYAEQLLMVQLWHRPFFDGSSWVGPAWSISAEWLAYAAFPLVALLLWRLRRLPAGAATVLAVVLMGPLAALAWGTGTIYHPWSWLLRIGAGFLAGALTCLATRRIRRTPAVETGAALVALLALLAAVGGLYAAPRLTGRPSAGEAVVVLFPLLVGSLAVSRRGVSRLLSARPFVHGGHISYSLYLVHVPVLEILWTAMVRYPGPFALGQLAHKISVVAVIPLVLVLAHLSYRWLEEPARRVLRRRGPGRWAARPRAARPVPAPDVVSNLTAE